MFQIYLFRHQKLLKLTSVISANKGHKDFYSYLLEKLDIYLNIKNAMENFNYNVFDFTKYNDWLKDKQLPEDISKINWYH